MRAVQISQWGGPEVLQITDLPCPVPASGEVLIDVELAGVNFADTHQTGNQYVAKQSLPFVPGMEVVGTISGRRVVAFTGQGGYAEQVAARNELCFDIPDSVSSKEALALFVQGVSALHILTVTGSLKTGDTVVVNSAAGGIGLLFVQLAKALGAGRVIATASTEQKRSLALRVGADEAVDGAAEGLTERLLTANSGAPVDVVLDLAGGEIFEASFAALAPLGRIVAHGIASRQKNTVSTAQLLKTSRTVAGFWFGHLLNQPAKIASALEKLFDLLASGRIEVATSTVYKLEAVQSAHHELVSRKTVGKLLLDPTG